MAGRWLDLPMVDVPAALREAVGGHPVVARILALRGFLDPGAAAAFLNPELYTPISPWDIPGMEGVVALLRGAIARGEALRVWGDFDADGQTSTAVLVEALTVAGARVDYQLPSRDEGHGLHRRAVDQAMRDGVSLLMTCDTGIGEDDAIRYGVSSGLTMVITDHHDLPTVLPPAQAIVNPKVLPSGHALHELSGVGVAYMVARALLEPQHSAAREGAAGRMDALAAMLDLVALGLVADVSREVGDVHYLVQRGLETLRHTTRPGLQALMQAAALDPASLDEQDIGFKLGPRLNAAGRLANSEMAVCLLLTRDPVEAQQLAEQLEALNRDRQARTEAVQAMVDGGLSRNPDLLRQPAIIIDGEDWETGVLGLVAGELAKRYDRPAILIGHRAGEDSVGSARSVEGIDVHEAIASQRGLLIREGGHPMAAGFALARENVSAFRRGVLQFLAQAGPVRPALPPLAVDAEIPWEEVDLTLAQQLARLAPYGPGNPRPVLVLRGGTLLRVEDVSRVRETAHRRLYLDSDVGRQLRFTWFNAGILPVPGDRLDLAFHLSLDRWHGQERAQAELVDWRPAEETLQKDVATLIAGREVVDWRQEPDLQSCLARLRERYGPKAALWAEWGDGTPAVPGVGTRYDLSGKRASILAVVTAPPGPDELRWVLTEVQPQVIYLLPPVAVEEPTVPAFLERVAGMLRVALRAHEGWVDAVRMSARIGSRRATVVAALRWLEALGKVVLRYERGGLRAYEPNRQPPELELTTNQHDEEEGQRANRQSQAQQVVRSLLEETKAYRRAYAEQPLSALFYMPRS
jgi:single-stranded-DNA-specific exonuclease